MSVALIATSVGLWLGDPDVHVDTARRLIEPLAVAGGVLFALGTPAIHWAHGRVGIGFGSLGIRVTAGAVFAIGLGLLEFGQPCSGLGCNGATGEPGEMVLGGLLAIAAAVTPPILDAVYLAHEPAPVSKPAAMRVVPSLVPTPGGAALGLVGAF